MKVLSTAVAILLSSGEAVSAATRDRGSDGDHVR